MRPNSPASNGRDFDVTGSTELGALSVEIEKIENLKLKAETPRFME